MKKILFFICMGLFALTSCENDPDFSDMDLTPTVYTNYAEKANFKEYQTFYVPDSILEVKSYKCEPRDDANARKVISYIVKQMTDRGYVRTTNKDKADLGILMTHLQETNIIYGSWWDYYYWDYYYWDPFFDPWWGGWYYPATVSYAYQTNSFVIDMADMKNRGKLVNGEKPKLNIVWCAQIDAYQFDAHSLKGAIDQTFAQSPYLTNK